MLKTMPCFGIQKRVHPPTPENRTLVQTRRYTLVLRVFIVVLLIAIAVVCGFVTHSIVATLEKEKGEQYYESTAETALSGALSISRRRHDANEAVASMMAYAFPDAEQWPFVALAGYGDTVSRIAQLHNTKWHSFLPIVYPEDIPSFNEFAQNVYSDIGYGDFGFNSEGFGVWRLEEYETGSSKTAVDPSNSDYFAPFFLGLHNPDEWALFDAASSKYSGGAFKTILACAEEGGPDRQCSATTEMIPILFDYAGGPLGIFYSPVFPVNNPEKVMGFLSTDFQFLELLANVGTYFYFFATRHVFYYTSLEMVSFLTELSS